MLNPEKLTAAFSSLVASAPVEAAAKPGWTIEAPDKCPDCKDQMRPSACMNTRLLTCFKCRICLPMPNDYVPPKDMDLSTPPKENGTMRSKIDPLDALDVYTMYDAP